MKQPRVFYVVYAEDVESQKALDAIRLLAEPTEKNRAHITVRGPYSQHRHFPAANRKLKGSLVTVDGPGTFFGPRQHTVFLSCDSPALRDAWHKPHLKDVHPHLTIYDGSSRAFAESLAEVLEDVSPRFAFRASALQPLTTTKGQGDIQLPVSYDAAFVRRVTGQEVPLQKIADLRDAERLDLIRHIVFYLNSRNSAVAMPSSKSCVGPSWNHKATGGFMGASSKLGVLENRIQSLSAAAEVDAMTNQVTKIRVLVASPNDLEEERLALEQIVRVLNLMWSDALNLQLELVHWRTHATPGIGTDPQQVITEQIGDKYDIFLGIMWARFGTPTPRAGSGTEEEFDRALARYKQAPSSIDVMFYFKDSPLSPSQVDPDELAAVRRFKQELGPEGVLYWDFRSPEEFQSLLMLHLGKKVQGWQQRLAGAGIAPKTPVSADSVSVEDVLVDAEIGEMSEIGLLELTETQEEALAELGEIATRMAEDIYTLGAKFRERTAETQAITPADTSQKRQTAKRIVKRAADDMNHYVERTRVELPPFSAALRRGLEAYGRALSITTEFGPQAADQIHLALEQIASLRVSLADATEGASGMKESIAKFPRMSADLIIAKKRTVAALADIVEEFKSADRLLSEVVTSMTDWLSQNSE